jgi:hypothetical protein
MAIPLHHKSMACPNSARPQRAAQRRARERTETERAWGAEPKAVDVAAPRQGGRWEG